jgi:sulfoxide reductase heme-binding subunit YedZ
MQAGLNAALRRVPPWAVYLGLGLYAPWLLWMALTGGLGVEPVKALEHALGLFALQLLIAGLAVTPLRRLVGINLLRFRRAIGVMAFVYVALHLLVWLFLDVQLPAQIWTDIVKRPYITIGMAGFVLLLPLALTSSDWAVRRLGPVRWRRLHRLAYGAALLGGVHYLMGVKTLHAEPVLYMAAIILLLILRLPMRSKAPA